MGFSLSDVQLKKIEAKLSQPITVADQVLSNALRISDPQMIASARIGHDLQQSRGAVTTAQKKEGFYCEKRVFKDSGRAYSES